MTAVADRCGCGHPATAHTRSRIVNLKSMWLTCARMVEVAPGEWNRCGCKILDGDCDFCGHPVASHVSAGFAGTMWRVCSTKKDAHVSPEPCGCMI